MATEATRTLRSRKAEANETRCLISTCVVIHLGQYITATAAAQNYHNRTRKSRTKTEKPRVLQAWDVWWYAFSCSTQPFKPNVTSTQTNHAKQEGQNTLEHIQALHQLHSIESWDSITQLRAQPPADNAAMQDALGELEWITIDNLEQLREAVVEAAREMPLSVTVRSGWYVPGTAEGKPIEFCILMSTGGPALRIFGELDQYDCPCDPVMQWQDWFQPWQTLEHDNDAALEWFCGCFYFGG